MIAQGLIMVLAMCWILIEGNMLRIASSPKDLPLVNYGRSYPNIRGKVWVDSDRGLLLCQTEGQSIEAFLHNQVDPNSISDNQYLVHM
ncbi:MAG: hypothetical protein IPH84_03235 [Bacteroidales bacterium]|nr:hypothetical protein [Bacteroidales bacterium]